MAKKRKRGRPPTTGIGTQVQVRCHADLLRRIDEWAKRAKLSRPEAFRRLAELGLTVQPR